MKLPFIFFLTLCIPTLNLLGGVIPPQENINLLYQGGLKAIKEKNAEQATKEFETLHHLFQQKSTHNINWPIYIDITNALCKLYEESFEKKKAERLVSQVLLKTPPKTYLPQLHYLMMTVSEKKDLTYLSLLKVTEDYPLNFWAPKERLFFLSLEQSMNEHYERLLHNANAFVNAEQYALAEKLYLQIKEGVEKKYYPRSLHNSFFYDRINYKIAECRLKQDAPPSLASIQNYNIAQAAYTDALQLCKKNHVEDYLQALYEDAISHELSQKKELAKSLFQQVIEYRFSPPSKIQLLSTLHLARILLSEKEAFSVLSLLMPLFETALTSFHLSEIYFLSAQASFLLQDYSGAKEKFEKSYQLERNTPWALSSILHLGWCYLEMAQSCQTFSESEIYLTTAEKLFENSLKTKEWEQGLISMCHLFLIKSKILEFDALAAIEKLSQQNWNTCTLKTQWHCLLLSAEATPDLQKKAYFYKKATDSVYQHLAGYQDACMLKMIYYSETGCNVEIVIPEIDKVLSLSEKIDAISTSWLSAHHFLNL